MKKHFYSHIIETDSLVVKLTELDITEEEKAHLIGLIDSNLHHTIVDAILSELSPDDKKAFMEHFDSDNHDEVWKLLHNKVDNIEEKIKNAAEALKKELHEDIKEAKGN